MTDAPKPSINALRAQGQSDHDTDYWDDGECFQCGGEGYFYGCSWDWQCDTYDDGEGTCLCSRRCDVCNPVELTPAEQAERDALRKVIADAWNQGAAVVIDKDGVRVSLPVKEDDGE